MMDKPTIKGTRITVEFIMRKLAGGFTVVVLLASYPFLTQEQVNATFQFAAELIANEENVEVC